jgi:hypothetical protein
MSNISRDVTLRACVRSISLRCRVALCGNRVSLYGNQAPLTAAQWTCRWGDRRLARASAPATLRAALAGRARSRPLAVAAHLIKSPRRFSVRRPCWCPGIRTGHGPGQGTTFTWWVGTGSWHCWQVSPARSSPPHTVYCATRGGPSDPALFVVGHASRRIHLLGVLPTRRLSGPEGAKSADGPR